MDKPKITAKDFFLWAGAMVAFYWSVIAYVFLVFDYINYAFPNVLSFYPADPYQSGISYEMASIIVLLPFYLLLMRFIHRDASRDPSRNEIWVRRWALILTLFVAGITIAVDLITLLTTFLNGEALTLAFMLKVTVILLVAAGVFMHFIADLKGYWNTFPSRRNAVRSGVAVLAVATILAGFLIVGTPRQARLARYDAQRVSDLQNIQSQVVSYYQAKQKLPVVIADLNNSLSYGPPPVDAQTGESYIYKTTGPFSFQLCATFNAQGRSATQTRGIVAYPTPAGVEGYVTKDTTQDNWSHGAGQVCFDRTIDPAFYPPLIKQ
jgi:type II secretory pathway pseudopilin PulG